MNLLCRVFGHRVGVFWGEPVYGAVVRGPVDGIGREHGWVKVECDRCGAEFVVIKIHLPGHKDGKPRVTR